MDTNIFYIKDDKIYFNTHKVTIRHYSLNGEDVDENTYTDDVQYVNDEGLNELEVNYVPKHKLLEIVSKETINPGIYSWMEGIAINANENISEQIKDIASYGSLEAYRASLPESADDFRLDVDYRLSKLELGL